MRDRRNRVFWIRVLAVVAAITCWHASFPSAASANALLNAAISSVTSDELHEHVEVLADDVYEGRGAGTSGGRAAGQYLVRELRNYSLEPAGTDGDFYQAIHDQSGAGGGRNILALLPGNDPKLAHELIVVGAHYDHVGRGKNGSSFGPIGEIHNGADDNASGISVLLETIEAMATTGIVGRRSILFAFWDSEEIGLLGSKHWLANTTLPKHHVKLAIHADMVGRLRDGRLQVLGTRSGYGLRELASGGVNDPVWLDFSWELLANSDHWPFLQQRVPVVLLHTGIHDDYHRPSDDVERINSDGLRHVSRYLLSLLVKAASVDKLPAFREAVRKETLATQRRVEGRARSRELARWPADLPLPRLGISWRSSDAEPGAVYLTRVIEGTPAAAAGLLPLDRVYAIDGQAIASEEDFRTRILHLLDMPGQEFSLQIESRGHLRTIVIKSPSLSEGSIAPDIP